MKNFDWTAFSLRILVKAPISKVYEAWSRSSELEKWFLKTAEFQNRERETISGGTAVESGFSYAWSWYLYEMTERGRFLDANGKDHLQFTFAGDCLVEVRLSEREGEVLVELSQRNIPTDDLSKKDIRLGCQSGWSFYLVNLKSYCEGGLDLRNKNDNFRPMVNN
jgi:uncharacterized protein YndB with AHSA1/START domain